MNNEPPTPLGNPLDHQSWSNNNQDNKPAQQTASETQIKVSHPPILLGFLLSIFIAPAGLALSIITLLELREHKMKGQKLVIAGIVIGSLLTLALVVVVGFVVYALYEVTGSGHTNQAQSDLQPILASVQNLGGRAICDDGDNGYTLDNSQPWYEVYYSVPSTKNLTSEVENISAAKGYRLKVDGDTISQLKTGKEQGQQYNASSDYLVSQKDGSSLTIVINRNTSVALNCTSGTYGRLQRTNSNAIIDFTMTLPSTN
jgi:hypothetical protein